MHELRSPYLQPNIFEGQQPGPSGNRSNAQLRLRLQHLPCQPGPCSSGHLGKGNLESWTLPQQQTRGGCKFAGLPLPMCCQAAMEPRATGRLPRPTVPPPPSHLQRSQISLPADLASLRRSLYDFGFKLLPVVVKPGNTRQPRSVWLPVPTRQRRCCRHMARSLPISSLGLKHQLHLSQCDLPASEQKPCAPKELASVGSMRSLAGSFVKQLQLLLLSSERGLLHHVSPETLCWRTDESRT